MRACPLNVNISFDIWIFIIFHGHVGWGLNYEHVSKIPLVPLRECPQRILKLLFEEAESLKIPLALNIMQINCVCTILVKLLN